MATTAVVKKPAQEMMDFLKSPQVLQSIQQACTKHVNAERLVRVIATSISRNPDIALCSKASVALAALNCAQLGVEPLLNRAHLVPFNNSKTGQKEAQFILGYQGLIELARRSGTIKDICAEAVYEKDEFSFTKGMHRDLIHKPYLGDDDPGPLKYAYAIAWFMDGGSHIEVMTRRELESIRKRSRAGNGGPWVSDYAAMCRKTVIRALAKYLPLTVEVSESIEQDTQTEFVDVSFDAFTGEVSAAPQQSSTEKIKQKVRKEVNVTPAETPFEDEPVKSDVSLAPSESTEKPTDPETVPPSILRQAISREGVKDLAQVYNWGQAFYGLKEGHAIDRLPEDIKRRICDEPGWLAAELAK